MRHLRTLVTASALVLFVTKSATANTPIDDTCSGASECVKATNSGTSYGLLIQNNGTGSSNAAILATSQTGAGIIAESTSNNGVQGTTTFNMNGFAAGFFSTGAGGNSTAVAAENSSAGTGLYATSNGGYAGIFGGNVNVTGQIQTNGTCQLNCPSDRRLKQNIVPLTDALETLLKLKGTTFEYRPSDDKSIPIGPQIGFIAQDVEAVFPQWVNTNRNGFLALTIQPTQIAALEIESLRTLKVENDALRQRVTALEAARHSILSLNGGAFGLAIGFAVAGAFAGSRRKREQAR